MDFKEYLKATILKEADLPEAKIIKKGSKYVAIDKNGKTLASSNTVNIVRTVAEKKGYKVSLGKGEIKEYTEKEALVKGKKVQDKAAALVKKYGKGAVKHAGDPAVKAEVERKLLYLTPQKYR